MKFSSAAVAAVVSFAFGAAAWAPAYSQSQPAAPSATEAAPQPPLIDPAIIDATLQGYVNDKRLVGVSALVFQQDKEVYFGAFGLADRENDKPMTRDTIVQIFSMTKPVVGVALMQMYERGKFKLDDPLANYLPEYANVKVYAGEDADGQPILEPPKRPITVRDILRHTAGFIRGADDSPVGRLYREANINGGFNNTLPQVSEALAKVPLLYQPGTRWLYSDAVDIQAALTQKLSGVPFDEYLKLHIFRPLGMTSTRYTILPTDPDRGNLAALYMRNDDGTFTRLPDEEALRFNSADWPYKPGSFGLVSNIDDYMKFARMLQGGGKLGRARILKPETVKLMATDALPKDVTDKGFLPSKGSVGFGIDFAVRTVPPKDAEEQSGAVGEFFWDGAASTLFWVDPKNQVTAVLFTQFVPFDRIKLHKSFRDAVYHNIPEALAK